MTCLAISHITFGNRKELAPKALRSQHAVTDAFRLLIQLLIPRQNEGYSSVFKQVTASRVSDYKYIVIPCLIHSIVQITFVASVHLAKACDIRSPSSLYKIRTYIFYPYGC